MQLFGIPKPNYFNVRSYTVVARGNQSLIKYDCKFPYACVHWQAALTYLFIYTHKSHMDYKSLLKYSILFGILLPLLCHE